MEQLVRWQWEATLRKNGEEDDQDETRGMGSTISILKQLVPDNIRREMQAISYGEGKTDPLTAKVRADNARSGVRVNYRTGRR